MTRRYDAPEAAKEKVQVPPPAPGAAQGEAEVLTVTPALAGQNAAAAPAAIACDHCVHAYIVPPNAIEQLPTMVVSGPTEVSAPASATTAAPAGSAVELLHAATPIEDIARTKSERVAIIWIVSQRRHWDAGCACRFGRRSAGAPEAATQAAFRDGWFLTGDMARRDAAGRLFVVDRKKDMIITGGENVYSREVEDLLYEHPAVAEAAVVGEPDTTWGENVVALIRVREGQSADPASLDAFCKVRIAGYKRPRRYVFVPSMPTNASGKPDREAIAKLTA